MARAVWIAAAMWLPQIAALGLNHQVRPAWHDVWLWPGAVPGRYFVEGFYSRSFGWFTLASLAGWLLLSRWRLRLAVGGALLQSTVSALYICAAAAT